MDDGYSPVSMVILLAFIMLSAVLHGFGAAIQHVNETKLEEEKEKGTEGLFAQIIAENIPDLGRETGIQVQEAQRTPSK